MKAQNSSLFFSDKIKKRVIRFYFNFSSFDSLHNCKQSYCSTFFIYVIKNKYMWNKNAENHVLKLSTVFFFCWKKTANFLRVDNPRNLTQKRSWSDILRRKWYLRSRLCRHLVVEPSIKKLRDYQQSFFGAGLVLYQIFRIIFFAATLPLRGYSTVSCILNRVSELNKTSYKYFEEANLKIWFSSINWRWHFLSAPSGSRVLEHWFYLKCIFSQ
jgi:hypothetical protein